MNNENKPLTAEEIQKQGNEWACKMMDKYFPDIDCVDPMWRRIADLYMHAYTESYKVGKEYAAQQTAEKDARIKELESWKSQQMEVTGPLYEYGQSREAGVPLGESIFAAALSAWKKLPAVEKQWDELKGQCAKHTVAFGFERMQHEKAIKERDALKKQLETAVDILENWPNRNCYPNDVHGYYDDLNEWSSMNTEFLASLQTTGKDVSPAPTLDEAFELIYSEDGPEFVGNMHDIFKAGFEAAQGIFPDYVTTKK